MRETAQICVPLDGIRFLLRRSLLSTGIVLYDFSMDVSLVWCLYRGGWVLGRGDCHGDNVTRAWAWDKALLSTPYWAPVE